MRNPSPFSYFIVSLFILSLQSCISDNHPEENPTVATMNDIVTEGIRKRLSANDEAGKNIADSLQFSTAVINTYRGNDFAPLWSIKGVSKPIMDTFISYLQHSISDGLFPEDYNFKKLNDYFTLIKNDSIARTKPALWIDIDINYTAALLHVIYDLKYGRLVADSLAHDKNNDYYDTTLATYAKSIISSDDFHYSIQKIQPKHNGYWELKNGIQKFIDSMDTKQYTYLDFPVTDSALFLSKLSIRLKEAGYQISKQKLNDSASLAIIIAKYQVAHRLAKDGKPGREVKLLYN
jgi:murein L,D-transpeptidase YcbB/YkuD